jgi:ribosomal protein S18 acetylase RimI-like enzyme
MEIRRAKIEDIENIVALGERGHSRSSSADFDFSGMRARILVAACVSRRNMCAFVALVNGNVVGFVLGHSDEFPYIAMRYATDLAIYSEVPGAGRKLIERFTSWAFDEAGADKVILSVIYGGRSERGATALYKRLGFEHAGGMFTKTRSTR